MMPKDEKITCDNCGRDLTTTGNSVDYRLALINQSVPSWGGAVTDVMIYPPLKGNAYFCGINCLRGWLDENRNS